MQGLETCEKCTKESRTLYGKFINGHLLNVCARCAGRPAGAEVNSGIVVDEVDL